jgi:hypothetical protein
VEALPPGFHATGRSANAPLAVMENPERGYYGLQFHPEVTHTPQGRKIICRFVKDVSGCPGDWTPGHIVQDAIARVRRTVGDGRVLLALSGGVDSSVVAALLHEAIGDQLVCVFVDHGLLRYGEAEQVMELEGIKPGMSVADIGAGDGYYTVRLAAQVGEDGRLLANDIDEDALRRLGDRVELDVPALAFDVIEIPGHTSSHVAFHGHGLLFCGDTLFSVGCGHLFEGTPAQMLASLERLAALPSDTRVCCGHEYTLANCTFARTLEPGPGGGEEAGEEHGSQLVLQH